MTEPRWLVAARAQIGQREIRGAKHNPRIVRWFAAIRAPFTDDETPWCAAFVGGMLESVGVKSSRSAAARSYLKWGRPLTTPVLGCVVVFSRGPVNGHVAFYVGKRGDSVLVLGGNQNDAVNISAYPKARVLGYRWPNNEPFPDQAQKPPPDVPAPRQPEPPKHAPPPPDVEPPTKDEDDVPSFTKKGMWTTIATFAASAAGSLADWKVAAVLATAGVSVFLILYFTRKR